MNVPTNSPDYNTELGQLLAADQPLQFRNVLDGGDFTVNPWQRNIAGLASGGVISSAISNTVTYFADRWFAVGGSSSAILMAQVTESSIPGFGYSLKLSRQSSNSNTATINFGQVIESLDTVRLQGKQITFSFYAKQGANYSGGALTVQVIYGTGTNQSASSAVAGTWTSQGYVINTTQSLSTSMTRYSFSAIVPSSATELAVLLSWTPSGTAGSDDSITLNGLQLEVAGTAVVAGGTTTYAPSPTNFEHRDIQVELEMCQRYCYVISEPAAGVIVGVGGAVASANNQVFYMALPVQMIKAPTVTVSAGSFKVAAAAAAAAASGMAAGSTHTVNAISITSTLTETVGLSATLQGGGGSGYVLASADF
jgi:hypothetical protein